MEREISYYRDKKIIWPKDEVSEDDVFEIVDEMIDSSYSELSEAQEIDLTFLSDDEEANCVIDGQLYAWINGRLYGSYGEVKYKDGHWWKKLA